MMSPAAHSSFSRLRQSSAAWLRPFSPRNVTRRLENVAFDAHVSAARGYVQHAISSIAGLHMVKLLMAPFKRGHFNAILSAVFS